MREGSGGWGNPLSDRHKHPILDVCAGVPPMGLGIVRTLDAGATISQIATERPRLERFHGWADPLLVGLDGFLECLLRLEIANSVCHGECAFCGWAAIEVPNYITKLARVK